MDENFQKFILGIMALLGLTGGVLMTGYGDVNSPGPVVNMLAGAYDWAHTGSIQRCYFEVHAEDNKTINSVSFKATDASDSYVIGNATSWIAGYRNSTDWLIYYSDNFTASSTNYTCQIRVVQNQFPGTQENISNATFSTIGAGIPGCLGQADCVVSSLQSIGNVIHRDISVITGQILTVSSGSTIKFRTLKNTGDIRSVAGTINFQGDFINNSGVISVSGADCGYQVPPTNGGLINLSSVSEVNNSGTLSAIGGAGGCGSGACSGSAGCSCQSPAYGNYGGANGGNISTSTSTLISNIGTITINGGKGGDASNPYYGVGGCSANGCPATTGGTAGQMMINSSFTFINSGSISANGGNGGGSALYCGAAGQGNSKSQYIYARSVFNNTNVLSATGTSGAWNIYACSYSNTGTITPSPTNQSLTCYAKPTASITSPNATSTYMALLSNITASYSNVNGSGMELWFSQNNGSTWKRLLPYENNYSLPSASTSYSFGTHRLMNSTTNLIRVRAYNSSTYLYSDFATTSFFNTTYIPTNITQVSIPNGSVTTSTVMFSCRYINATTGNPITSANAYVEIDGVAYEASYNVNSQTYNYTNNNTWAAGNHSWRCVMSKTDWSAKTASNSSVFLGGFGLFYPPGQTGVNFVCPFPTIYAMTPAGQKAGVGIVRIQNFNFTANKSYSVQLDSLPPIGINIYTRCDRFQSGTSLTGWTILPTSSAYQCLNNISSANISAYFWMKIDCISATPGNYNLTYNFTES